MTPPARAHWNVTEHLPAGRIIIQGHRGAGDLAEENTLETFALAWRMGLQPEADLRMTRDGVIVPFHDDNFARVLPHAAPERRGQGVADLTYAELAQLDVGAWKGPQFAGRRVPRMVEVFARLRERPERGLYMDVKRIEFPLLAEEVRRHDVERQVTLASSRIEELRSWHALMPNAGTLLWLHGDMAALQRELERLRATNFQGITQVQVHVYPKQSDEAWAPPPDPSPADNPFRLPDEFLRALGDELRAHYLVFQVLPFTKDAGAYAHLLDLGVMSFATDHPEVTRQAINTYYQTRQQGSGDSRTGGRT